MLSFDTNLLFHAFNEDSPLHRPAMAWLESIRLKEEVVVSEFILAEFYGLLRNPAALRRPLAPDDAVEVVQVYRRHPRWRLVGFPPESRSFHDHIWQKARSRHFAYRRLFDVRTAFSLIVQGVTEFATINTKNFADLGFRKVWNPLA
jgi:toxin-antitoxin system PIN domain toxin